MYNANGIQGLPIVVGILAVLLIAAAGWLITRRLRRNLLRNSQDAVGSWSLEDLRDMRDSGQLTEQEYQVLRERMVRKAMAAQARSKGQSKSADDSAR